MRSEDVLPSTFDVPTAFDGFPPIAGGQDDVELMTMENGLHRLEAGWTSSSYIGASLDSPGKVYVCAVGAVLAESGCTEADIDGLSTDALKRFVENDLIETAR